MPPVRRPRRLDPLNRTSLAFHPVVTTSSWLGRSWQSASSSTCRSVPCAHGGHCVARVGDDPDGRVVFVRHALPGERVRAVITELRRLLRPRRRGRDHPAVTGPGAAALPARRTRALRRLRLAARIWRGAARVEGAGRPRAVPASRRDGRHRAAPRSRGAAWRPVGLADPHAVRRRRGRPARTAPASVTRRRAGGRLPARCGGRR